MMRTPLLVVGFALGAALVGGVDLAASGPSRQGASPVAPPPLVAAYAEALNAHDPDRVAALYAENAVVEQAVRGGNVFRGREAIRGWVAANLAGVPDLVVTTETTVAEGDRIAWAWVYDGAYTGRYPGLPAGEGQPIVLRGVSLLAVADGLITRETVYFDDDAFLAEADGRGAAATPGAGTPHP